MKNVFYTVIITLFIIFSSILYAFDKFVVVNISNILQKISEKEKISKKIENEFKLRLDTLQNQGKNLEKKIENFQKERLTMKDTDRVKIEKDIIEEKEIFEKKAQNFEKDNRRRQNEENKKMLERIQNAINKIARIKEYEIILDTDAVLYAEKSKDITDDVLKQVQ